MSVRDVLLGNVDVISDTETVTSIFKHSKYYVNYYVVVHILVAHDIW
jgi:hypothetical protein